MTLNKVLGAKLTAESLKSLPPKEVKAALSSLSKKQLEELQYDWDFWARDKQREPEGDWYIWYINAGRSFGKTRTGAEWVRQQVKQGVKDIAIVGRTSAETSDVCLFGRSGLLNVCWEGDKDIYGKHMGVPKYNKTEKKLKWANGAVAKLFSSEEPEAPRGSQFEIFWLDELGSWTYQDETFDQIQFCMRLGKRPRGLITTTPRSTPLIRKLIKRASTGEVHLTEGSTFENTAMPDSFFTEMRDKYEGTRLGEQELYAKVLDENEGALWTHDMVLKSHIRRGDVPELSKIVVSLDPATTSNVESDLTGIIVAGLDENDTAYILEDHTFKGLPEAWASKAIELYHRWNANYIVYEKNQGGDLIPTVIKNIDADVPLKGVFASNAKIARAEPVSLLYEKGRVKHVTDPEFGQSLGELEIQMTTFEPMGKHKSPDRYDAMVWAVTELLLKGRAKPTLRMASV